MAPRTSTRNRKERRKWIKNQQQHRLQQQEMEPERDERKFPRSFPLTPAAMETNSQRLLGTTTDVGVDNKSQEIRKDPITTSCDDEPNAGTTAATAISDQQLHPPDCTCSLRKQSRGKNLFLPPPSLSSAMDGYYCFEESSTTSYTNRTR